MYVCKQSSFGYLEATKWHGPHLCVAVYILNRKVRGHQ